MAAYKLTEEDRDLIRELNEFHAAVEDWRASEPSEKQRVRSQINQRIDRVREIVLLAGCHITMTIGPPPAVGGLVMQNVSPFNYIFESIYGKWLHGELFDMLDRTIGVIQSGKYQERKSRLEKAQGPMGPISGSKVFLVHGHDEAVKQTTARFLEKLKLEAIILHEQPSSGRTLIEKVEQYAEVAFAVVLLTPDDVGAPCDQQAKLRPRARQNVILELGYFLGRLDRSRVAALVKGEVERPSDYDGVVYIDMDGPGAWKLKLAKELKTAGLNVDLNDVV